MFDLLRQSIKSNNKTLIYHTRHCPTFLPDARNTNRCREHHILIGMYIWQYVREVDASLYEVLIHRGNFDKLLMERNVVDFIEK